MNAIQDISAATVTVQTLLVVFTVPVRHLSTVLSVSLMQMSV